MSIVERAVWVIEHRLDEPLRLAEIAGSCGVSQFHLARAFVAATGRTVMGYRRDRRLTEAARALADGAPDILAVALDAGYGSHEAFTRAFSRAFGCAPEAVRAAGHLDTLMLTECFTMNPEPAPTLSEPRREVGRLLRIAGLAGRYTPETIQGIPGQWGRFEPWIGQVSGQVGSVTYGVCVPQGEGAFDYVSGVEVADFGSVPDTFRQVAIVPPRGGYLVFRHEGHISGIARTARSIWDDWLPARGIAVTDAPDFERYDDRFDPKTGNGVVEIWIPLAGK